MNQIQSTPKFTKSLLHLHSEPKYAPNVTFIVTSFFIFNAELKPDILVKVTTIVGVNIIDDTVYTPFWKAGTWPF